MEIPEDIREAAIRAADEYRANTGDNGFNLSFDGTMGAAFDGHPRGA